MTRMSLTLLVIGVFCQIVFSHTQCGCVKAMSQDETIWGHIATKEKIDSPIREITGTVLDPGGFPLKGALVEVFADDGIHRTPTTPKTKRKGAKRTIREDFVLLG